MENFFVNTADVGYVAILNLTNWNTVDTTGVKRPLWCSVLILPKRSLTSFVTSYFFVVQNT